MKPKQLQTAGIYVRNIVAAPCTLLLALAAPVASQTLVVNAIPISVASASAQAPKGVKVVARVALNGQPATRMYTQSEYGRTYLYIEHANQKLTSVDVTNEHNPKVVNHGPAHVEPTRYEELAEGGTIEVSPQWGVNPGVDTVGGRGTLSILQDANPDDVPLLKAFGRESSNLVDPDDKLIFFASPTELLIVHDGRRTLIDYSM